MVASPNQIPVEQCQRSALEILDAEIRALEGLRSRVDGPFCEAVARVLAAKGRVVTTGMGKAGIIAIKVSATLASTGTPSYFLHPAEAIHGDLGRLVEGDLLLAFSKSGQTAEVLRLVPQLKALGVELIAMTESQDSPLGRHADIVLELGPIDEAGQHGLAPTASTIAMLAMGDMLAMVVQEGRDFGKRDFARFHPGGSLGRSLMKVEECMRKGEQLPTIGDDVGVSEAIVRMTNTPGRPGAVIIVDQRGHLQGLFTDGDLRRQLESGGSGILERHIAEVMTYSPKRAYADQLVAEALSVLRAHRIDQLPVVASEEDPRVVGLIDVQDTLDLKF
ncbi:MAG: KpsF/GutQ family sugar-phosphate isomerase [Planctomycetota bacterium]|nr:MAG: KpsF/GutQ family sugar-phosphate isomerase [Planctomycetota bacterium]